MMTDLIERLKKESRDLHKWAHLDNGGEPAELTANLIDEAITALSPVLPDDVTQMVEALKHQSALLPAACYGSAADLLECQQQRIAELEAKLIAVYELLESEKSGF